MAARAVSDALEPVGPEGVELAAQEGLGRPIRPDRTQERTLERPLRVSPVYTPQVIEEIQDKALLGRYRIRGFGTLRQKPLPSLDDLTFLPASLTRIPLEGYRETKRSRSRFRGTPYMNLSVLSIAVA